MSAVYKNRVVVPATNPGQNRVVAHGLRTNNNEGLAPDLVFVEDAEGPFVYVTSDETTITLKNVGPDAATTTVFVEHWYSPERAVPPGFVPPIVGYTQVPEAPIVLEGSTPGLGANESVELLAVSGTDGDTHLGLAMFPLNLQETYEIVCTVAGFDPAAPATLMTKKIQVNKGTVYSDGAQLHFSGVGLASGADGAADNGTAAPNGWALTVSRATAPERMKLTFATGAGNTSKVNVRAYVEFTPGPSFPTP
jgi:hypothetical protein